MTTKFPFPFDPALYSGHDDPADCLPSGFDLDVESQHCVEFIDDWDVDGIIYCPWKPGCGKPLKDCPRIAEVNARRARMHHMPKRVQ